MSKRQIARMIYLTGMSGNYKVVTSGFAGLPYGIDVTNAPVGFAIQRALREQATAKTELFPAV